MVSQRVASRSQVIRRQREPSSKNVKARFVGHSANRMFRLPPWIATCGVRLFVAATVLSVAVFAATIPQRFATLDGDENGSTEGSATFAGLAPRQQEWSRGKESVAALWNEEDKQRSRRSQGRCIGNARALPRAVRQRRHGDTAGQNSEMNRELRLWGTTSGELQQAPFPRGQMADRVQPARE